MTTQTYRSATVEIATDALTAWNYVTDLSNMGTLSPECRSAEWAEGAAGPESGAKINGSNKAGDFEWETTSTVVAATPGIDFTFAVVTDTMPTTIWRYLFQETETGCVVTESVDCPGAANFGPDRIDILQQGIETTLDRLKTALEK